MKGVNKLKVVLSWEDNNYCCIFKRGRDTEYWDDLSLDEQKLVIGAMVTMSDLFRNFLKKENK